MPHLLPSFTVPTTAHVETREIRHGSFRFGLVRVCHLQISPHTRSIRKGKVQLSFPLQYHKLNGRVEVKLHTLLTLAQYPTVGFTLRLFSPQTVPTVQQSG